MAETQPSSKRLGYLVVFFSIVIGAAPYVGKAYLRAGIPSSMIEKSLARSMQSMGTFTFLVEQMHAAMQTARHDGEQLAAHSSQSNKWLAKFRDTMSTLDVLHAKYEQAGLALYSECDWEANNLIPYRVLKTQFDEKQVALKEAQKLQIFMMIAFTAIATVFLTKVMRSKQVPVWAKYFAMMAGGGVIGAWFPL